MDKIAFINMAKTGNKTSGLSGVEPAVSLFKKNNNNK